LNRHNQSRQAEGETAQTGSTVFALDIGTRSVVGILGTVTDDSFSVFDYEQRFHKKRAMRDGQIEDINLVAKTAAEIKEALGERNGMALERVSIAAAGRSLKTLRKVFEQDINEDEKITPELVRSLEFSAISAALDEFSPDGSIQDTYSCVGYDVVSYTLDGYPLSTPLGHRGRHIVIEIIAAFLPFSVIRSLYSVTALCGLTVDSLTLEPIAAINAVVPPDVRLLNIAITDIGAGTSDIGISKNGSIVAYDMVTIAGDEVTECLMKNYLVDFETAESIKFQLSEEGGFAEFTDIMGISRSCPKADVIETIDPVLDDLCGAVAESIVKINGGPPTALFLVGGGSQAPGLCRKIAGRLSIPQDRVTLGGKRPYRNIALHTEKLLTPEYVTPLGIGATSRLTHVHDLFSVTVNGEKIILPSGDNMKVLDALLLAGIKAGNLMGRTQASVTYYINNEKTTARGIPPVPGEIYVNKERAALDTAVRQGDEIIVLFAQHGKPPQLAISEVCKTFKGVLSISVNDKKVKKSYQVRSGDRIMVSFDSESDVSGAADSLFEGVYPTAAPMPAPEPVPEPEVPEPVPEPEVPEPVPEPEAAGPIRVCVNNEWKSVTANDGDSPLFLDMLNYVDIDTKKARGDLTLELNGNPASYTDPVHDGDRVDILWSL